MNQYTSIIPKDYIFFWEIIEQRLAKYGVKTRFNNSPEVSTFEIFLADDPINTIEVVECENSIALFRTLSGLSHETIQKLIGALENEFYTYMIYIENFKIPNQMSCNQEFSNMFFSENQSCDLDDIFYMRLLEAHNNKNSFKVPHERDIIENAFAMKIEMGLELITEDSALLFPENKNKLLIKINAKYRDIFLRFNGPSKSLEIVNWSLA
jgi:hypothetical protein